MNYKDCQTDFVDMGIRPVKNGKNGPMYLKSDVDSCVVKLINSESYFEKRASQMKSDVEKAIEKTNQATDGFASALDKFTDVERKFAEQSKKSSGNVRDAGEKLAQGLARIEKAANFDRLERYVDLLERAATAMISLAELEKSGKLEKISQAIR